MKKVVTVLMTMGICFMTLVACGAKTEVRNSNSEISQKEGKQTEIKYYGWYDEQVYMNDIIEAFEKKNPDIKVKATYVDNAGYSDKMVAMLMGGSDVDVFGTSTLKEYIKYRDAGNLLDISDLIGEKKINLEPYGDSFQITAKDKKYYALPYRNMCFSLYYNKKIFDQEKIPYPENITWEEYAELARKMTYQREDGTMLWGGFLIDWIGEPIGTVQNGSSILDQDTTELKSWLEFMGRLYNVDKSHMSYEEMKSSSVDGLKLFLNGDVAMLPNGEWTIGNAEKELKSNPDLADKFELGIAYMPVPEGVEEAVTVGGPACFSMINVKSQKQEAAFKFVNFLTGKEGAEILVKAKMMPSYTDDDIVELYQSIIQVPGAETMMTVKKRYEAEPVYEFADVDTIWREEKELYLIGEQSLEESMKNFIARRKEIFH
ncbi:multiple sugar transport system substrate-binding protein [Hungatella effluvii]|uniref:Multiple sugar transport system substrate-binding protein n=1 Tax=Hungatella effluvii TaxID=1096246 RepID=A0A2V3Y0D9_9FIRM|nr:sugar ABC transporter substrate-binding protein [Hungatella effluvii]PXX49220.1 multiple sugar transport system substrate-binding protein [Hungatella effluvii]